MLILLHRMSQEMAQTRRSAASAFMSVSRANRTFARMALKAEADQLRRQ
jgi:hypothetical protein